MWFGASWLPWVWLAMINPYRVCFENGWNYNTRECYTGSGWVTYGVRHYVDVTTIGSQLVYGFLWLFSLLAFIRTDTRIMQKIYYRMIAWLIPASWVISFWSLLAAIIGGAQKYKYYYGSGSYVELDSRIGYTLGSWILIWAVNGGLEALAWWQADEVVEYMRWRDQSWWNYDTQEVPDSWPSQLADSFADY